MDELLHHLESQIRKLVDSYDQLKQANRQLHQGKFLLAREKDWLSAKQEKAISHIQGLITNLKAIERETK